MKSFTLCVPFVFVLGCAAHNVQPATPATTTTVVVHSPDCTKDNFDRAGQTAADGARWIYNETLQAYEWATSEENKNRMHEVWVATKKSVSNFYNDGKSNTEKSK